MMDLEKIPKLHSLLKLNYGSDVHRNLNRLSALLRKLALSTTGLAFLLRCRRANVFPAFIRRSVRFSRLSHHLDRLAARLPRRILRAAIHDVRSREAREPIDNLFCVLAVQLYVVDSENACLALFS